MKTAARLLLVILIAAVASFGQAPTPRTKVVFLGTGVPNPSPERSGPATAIVVDDRVYLVDAGAGVMRRASAAARTTPQVSPAKIETAFITHLHSDHTIGLPDLIFTGWMMGRKKLAIYGPSGTAAMTRHLLAAWDADIEIRTQGLEHRAPLVVNSKDVDPGVIYKDEKVTVTAFLVAHGSWKQAFGYRFQTPDRVIVISGDTTPTDEVARQCNGCDLLIHETYSPTSLVPSMPDWKTYRAKYHTSTEELAELATRAKPKLLVVYHIAGRNPVGDGRYSGEEILREITASYHGHVVIAKDFDIF